MKIDKKYGLNLDRLRVDTWKIFLIKYLTLGETNFDFEFIRYKEEQGVYNRFFFLQFFLQLCEDFSIKIVKAGLSEYPQLPPETKLKIKKYLEKSNNKLLNKTLKQKLSVADLKKLLWEDFNHKPDILNNLSFEIKHGKKTQNELRRVLNYYIAKFIEGKVETTDTLI